VASTDESLLGKEADPEDLDAGKTNKTIVLMDLEEGRAVWTWPGLLIARRIVGPILRIATILKSMAESEGDLTVRLDATRKDELGTLSPYFNTSMERNSIFVRELRDLSFSPGGFLSGRGFTGVKARTA
jgi:methyl-accepting chemotaxis protein